MRAEQEMVELFHEKMGAPINTRPTLVPQELWELRAKLIAEELKEYIEACEAGDLVAIADALGDLEYVLLGTAVTHGIQLQPVFREVHRSNMTKDALDPVTKKGGKGPGYQAPCIAAVLFNQQHDTLGD